MISEGGKNLNKKKGLIKNTLVFGIIILFIGLAVQPGTATVQTDKNVEETKEFLFQTIIDIVNNEEIINLFNQEKNTGFFLDFDHSLRSIYRNILFKDPSLIGSLIFTNPTFTRNHLELAYEKGCKLINLIGEDKALEIIESIKNTNPTFSNGLSNIIKNNEDIKNKITEIKVMNQELNPTTPLEGYPLICAILLILTFTFAIPMVSIMVIILVLSSRPIFGPFFVAILGLFSANLALFLKLIQTFC